MRRKTHNIAILETIAQAMQTLVDEVVFVGGTTVELYIDDTAAPAVRPTDDVDCVVKITSRIELNKLEERLRKLGFKHPVFEPERRPLICRWSYQGVKVDVMPTDPSLLGFSNIWYESGVSQSVRQKLPSEKLIRIFPVLHFLAAKLEAFKDRGRGDFMLSHDLEDVVAILDGRLVIEADLAAGQGEVVTYLKNEFATMLANPKFHDSLAGHIGPGCHGHVLVAQG